MSEAVITAGIAAVGIVVGWYVIGTQRVTEELTKERRSAYAKVLKEAAEVAAGRAPNHRRFEQAVRDAEFLSSEQMYDARCLPALLVRVGEEEWQSSVDKFRELARFESQWNSRTRRWWRRSWYRELSSTTTSTRGAVEAR